MSALGTVGKMLQNSLSRGGAKRTKKNPAPELEKGTFDYISEPKSDYFSVGFAKTDVMPDDMDKTTYYVAGYKINNPAKGALDPMTAPQRLLAGFGLYSALVLHGYAIVYACDRLIG